MISAELMKEIKRIELKAGYLASDLLSGNIPLPLKGEAWNLTKLKLPAW